MEQTEWRVSGEVHWRRRYLVWPCIATATYVALALVLQHSRGGGGNFVGLAVLSVVTWSITVRRHVRLTDEGVEVRRIWKATYLWSEIAVVEPGPDWDDSRGRIRLVMHPGGPAAETETLPFPTTAGRSPTDTTVARAIQSIRRRLPAAAGEH